MTTDPSSSLAAAGATMSAAPLLTVTTTLLYATLVTLALIILRIRCGRGAHGFSCLRIALWCGLLAMLLAFGIDQHLKVSRSFMLTVREFARAGGWYEYRRPIQVAAIAVALVAVSLAARSFIQRSGKLAPGYRRVTIGAVLLIGFVGIRALSLHHIDSLMSYSLADLSVGRMGELIILLAMATGFFRWARYSAYAA